MKETEIHKNKQKQNRKTIAHRIIRKNKKNHTNISDDNKPTVSFLVAFSNVCTYPTLHICSIYILCIPKQYNMYADMMSPRFTLYIYVLHCTYMLDKYSSRAYHSFRLQVQIGYCNIYSIVVVATVLLLLLSSHILCSQNTNILDTHTAIYVVYLRIAMMPGLGLKQTFQPLM